MSSAQYESNSCKSCFEKNSYSPLANTTDYTCDQPCLCRFNEGRSSKDRMYYNWFVLDEPMNIPSGSGQIVPAPSDNGCAPGPTPSQGSAPARRSIRM